MMAQLLLQENNRRCVHKEVAGPNAGKMKAFVFTGEATCYQEAGDHLLAWSRAMR